MAYFAAKGNVDRVNDATNRKKLYFFLLSVSVSVDATCTHKELGSNDIDCHKRIDVSIFYIKHTLLHELSLTCIVTMFLANI